MKEIMERAKRLEQIHTRRTHVGGAWLCFCAALALHITDEALTGFLGVYNATVVALKQNFAFLVLPTFTFRQWLFGLVSLVLLMTAVSPALFKNSRWVRPLAYFMAVVAGILNAFGHTVATILGHTVGSVTFRRPAPGFYSSPILLIAAVTLLLDLRRSRGSSTVTSTAK
jgi:hypothetical protein